MPIPAGAIPLSAEEVQSLVPITPNSPSGAVPVDPFQEFDEPTLLDQLQKGNLTHADLKNYALTKLPPTERADEAQLAQRLKLARVSEAYKDTGITLSDLGQMAKNTPAALWSMGKGLAQTVGKVVSVTPGMLLSRGARSVLPGAPDWLKPSEPVIEKAVQTGGELLGGLEAEGTGLLHMAERAGSKVLGAVGLKTPFESLTNGQILANFDEDVAGAQAMQSASEGKGALTQALYGPETAAGSLLAQKGEGLRPEEIQKVSGAGLLGLPAFAAGGTAIKAGVGAAAKAALPAAALEAAAKVGAATAKAEQVAGDALSKGAGYVAKAAALGSLGAIDTAQFLGKLGPLIGLGVGAAKGGPVGAFAGMAAGEHVARRIGRILASVRRVTQRLDQSGKNLIAATPENAGPYGRMAFDVAHATPEFLRNVGAGALDDVFFALATSETPEEFRNQPMFGTFLRVVPSAVRVGQRATEGQEFASRNWESRASNVTPRDWEVQAAKSNETPYETFPELDAMHSEQIAAAIPGVQKRVGAMRAVVEPVKGQIYLAEPEQAAQFLLANSGRLAELAEAEKRVRSPMPGGLTSEQQVAERKNRIAAWKFIQAETAKEKAWIVNAVQQRGMTHWVIRGSERKLVNVVFAFEPDSAPHEAKHIFQAAAGKKATRVENFTVLNEMGRQSEEAGASYARRVLPEAARKEAAALGLGWREAWVRFQDKVGPNETVTPEYVKERSDELLATEAAADIYDGLVSHGGPELLLGRGLPGKLARVMAGVLQVMGQEPWGDFAVMKEAFDPKDRIRITRKAAMAVRDATRAQQGESPVAAKSATPATPAAPATPAPAAPATPTPAPAAPSATPTPTPSPGSVAEARAALDKANADLQGGYPKNLTPEQREQEHAARIAALEQAQKNLQALKEEAGIAAVVEKPVAVAPVSGVPYPVVIAEARLREAEAEAAKPSGNPTQRERRLMAVELAQQRLAEARAKFSVPAPDVVPAPAPAPAPVSPIPPVSPRSETPPVSKPAPAPTPKSEAPKPPAAKFVGSPEAVEKVIRDTPGAKTFQIEHAQVERLKSGQNDQVAAAQKDYDLEKDFASRFLRDEVNLEGFPYFEDYQKTIDAESGLLANPKSILFIGSGPVPLSAILLARKFPGASIEIADRSKEGLQLGADVAKKAGVTFADVSLSDATTEKDFSGYDTVVLALEAGPDQASKRQAIQNIWDNLDPNAVLLLRSSAGSTAGESFVRIRNLLPAEAKVVASTSTFGGLGETVKLVKPTAAVVPKEPPTPISPIPPVSPRGETPPASETAEAPAPKAEAPAPKPPAAKFVGTPEAVEKVIRDTPGTKTFQIEHAQVERDSEASRQQERDAQELARELPDDVRQKVDKIFTVRLGDDGKPRFIDTSKGRMVVGIAPIQRLVNAKRVAKMAVDAKRPDLVPYPTNGKDSLTVEGWRQLHSDLEKVQWNHEHGWRGDGTGPLKVPEGTDAFVPPDTMPKDGQLPVTQTKADFINLLNGASVAPPKSLRAAAGGVKHANVRAQEIARASSGKAEVAPRVQPLPTESGGFFGDELTAAIKGEAVPRAETNPLRKQMAEAGLPIYSVPDVESRVHLKHIHGIVARPDVRSDAVSSDVTRAGFSPARKAGVPKGKEQEAAKLWESRGTDSPYFKKWFGQSKVTDVSGNPKVVYHGTYREFQAFDLAKSGEHWDLGSGIYFSDSLADVNRNYANAEGSISNVAGLDTKSPRVISAYLRLENPARVSNSRTASTLFDLTDPRVKSELDRAGRNHPGEEGFSGWVEGLSRSDIPETVRKENLDFGFGTSKITANQLLNRVAVYPYVTGNWALTRKTFSNFLRNSGFDGVVVENASDRYQDLQVPEGAKHYLAFYPEQVKSTDNGGSFDASDPRMAFSPRRDMEGDRPDVRSDAVSSDVTRAGFSPRREEDVKRTGLAFKNFTSRTVRGEFGTSKVPFEPILDISNPGQQEFVETLAKHAGPFDDHIAKSIPTYLETQVRKGRAILRAYPAGASVLSIGGSEGAQFKTISDLSGGKIRTVTVDPNPDVADHFANRSTVPNAEFVQAGFLAGFKDGETEIPAFDTTERFDVINEGMVFQFISSDRVSQVDEVKRLLKPDGIFLCEEKVALPPEVWKANEAKKDADFKSRYFSSDDLAAKQAVVGISKPTAEGSVSMVDNMVPQKQLESTLRDQFGYVTQYWDSGNFKGYAASDAPEKLRRFVSSLGDLNSPFATTETPRSLPGNARFSARRPESLTAKEEADIAKAYRYFEIGHGPALDREGTEAGTYSKDKMWLYNPEQRQLLTGDSDSTHEGKWSGVERSYKGRYDDAQKKISVRFPDSVRDRFEAEGREPTEDDIPTEVYKSLRSKFGKKAQMVVFSPKRDAVAAGKEQEQPKFSPARAAGAPKGSEADAAKQWEEKGVSSPYFKRWFGRSKVRDEEGEPRVVYHGRLKEFDAFDKTKANPESDAGPGFYFTTERADSESNYASLDGPDQVVKLNSRIEQLQQEEPFITQSTQDPVEAYHNARLQAEKELGEQPGVLPAYLKIDRPAVISDDFKTSTKWDLADDTEGTALMEAIGAATDFLGGRGDRVWVEISGTTPNRGVTRGELRGRRDFTNEFENGGTVTAQQVLNHLQSADSAYDVEGGGSAIFNEAMKRLGFDGIKIENPSSRYHGMDYTEGAEHYVAFEPTQVKSVDNRGTFNPHEEAFRFSPKRQPGETESAFQERVDDENLARAGKYFSIGHGNDDADAPPTRDRAWVLDRQTNSILTGSGDKSHGIIWGRDKSESNYRGRYDDTTKKVSIIFPESERSKLGDREPKVDDIPTGVYSKLKRKFGEDVSFVAFSPKKEKWAPEQSEAERDAEIEAFEAARLARKAAQQPQQSKVKEGNLTLQPAGSDGISKAWILPNGKIQQLGAEWHHQWLEKNGARFGLTEEEISRGEAGNREAFIRKGAARVNYQSNTGSLTVEARQRDWATQKEAVRDLVEANLSKLDNVNVHLLNDNGTKQVDADSARLFKLKTPEEKLAALPFMEGSETQPVATAEGVGPTPYRQAQAFPEPTYSPKRFTHSDLPNELDKARKGESTGQTFNSDGSVWNPRNKKVDLVTLASVNLPQSQLTKENVVKALADKAPLLSLKGVVAGIAKLGNRKLRNTEGKLEQAWSIDLNSAVPQEHRDNSLQFAKDNGLKTIWDAKQGENINTGSTGDTVLTNPKDLFKAHELLQRGEAVDVGDLPILRGRSEELAEEQGGFDFLKSLEVRDPRHPSNMTRAEILKAHPEIYLPKNRTDLVDISGFDESPMFKRASSEAEAVKQVGEKLVAEYRAKKHLPEVQDGAKWYSRFVPLLKSHFGEDSQIMAELLAATSPRNNPTVNFQYASEALWKYKDGHYDGMIEKFLEGLNGLETGDTKRAYEEDLAAGQVANPVANPTPAAYMGHWIEKHGLKPTKANNKLFGATSDAVMQVLARVWMNEGRGPKVGNFVKNLLGVGHRATIDVWAGRLLRRLSHEGYVDQWRVLPSNDAGISDRNFDLGQQAFDYAAEKLGIEADALQGALWFSEKKHWADKGWQRLNLGDYATEMKKLPELRRKYEGGADPERPTLFSPQRDAPALLPIREEDREAFPDDDPDVTRRRLGLPGANLLFEESDKAIWVLSVGTEPKFRKQGLATRLLTWIKDYADREGKYLNWGTYTPEGDKYLKPVVARLESAKNGVDIRPRTR